MTDSSSMRAVVATLAEDRPGLVSELSELVHRLDLNIEDSRMTVLGGEFAVLMSVAGEETALAELEARLAAQAERGGFVYLFRRTRERPEAARQRFEVRIESMDHPGIVHGVASFFSERGVNIRELSTETAPAAHTGAPVFSLTMEIEVPADLAVDALEEAFAGYCGAEALDGELSAP